MTPRLRRAVLATIVFLGALAAFAGLRRVWARRHAAPLAEALVAFSRTNGEVLEGFADIVEAHHQSCSETEKLGAAHFAQLLPRHSEQFQTLSRLRAHSSPAVEDAAATLASAELRDLRQREDAREQRLLPLLRQFRRDCPAEAAALDARVVDWGHNMNAPWAR